MREQAEHWLADRGEPSSRTHKLTDLIVLLGDATLADLADEVRALDRLSLHAIQMRYLVAPRTTTRRGGSQGNSSFSQAGPKSVLAVRICRDLG